MEGIYLSDTEPKILLPAERPPGRQAFSCAHELGHHALGHGTRVDQLDGSGPMDTRDRDEQLANLFAAFLLMPKSAVIKGFRDRESEAKEPTPIQVLKVSQWLGVGYSTLLTHMVASLGLISREKANELRRHSPLKLANDLLGKSLPPRIWLPDKHWHARPVDVQVGDHIAVTQTVNVEGGVVKDTGQVGNYLLYRAYAPGRGRLVFQSADAATFIRVSRTNYVGLNRYRFLSDPDYEH